MASGRLSPVLITKARAGQAAPGKYSDGKNGLRLAVARSGAASWVMRYMHDGKRHDAGLGSLQHIGLSRARELAAAKLGALKGDKVDPLAERIEERAERRLASATFDVVAEAYTEAHRAGWRNAQHAKQWRATVTAYAVPVIGKVPVNEIDTAMVLEILQPLWRRVPPTASRLRGRIEAVLDYAAAQKLRSGPNPAMWRGNLKSLLPSVPKLEGEHLPALPLDRMPRAFAALRQMNSTAAKAAALCILCASRPGESVNAAWPEIELATATWTLPPHKTKQGQIHRVALSPPAIELLRSMERQRRDHRVFPTAGKRGPSGDKLLRAWRMAAGDDGVSLHASSRANFDDYISERTEFPAKLVDRALGHLPKGGMTVRAYRRADLLERRRAPMARWATFLTTPEAEPAAVPTRAREAPG